MSSERLLCARPPPSSPIVLIVDRHRDLASRPETLTTMGIRSVLVDDGDEALRLARELHSDVVVRELRLTGDSGLDLIRSLRADGPDVAIIVLTFRTCPADRTDATVAGRDASLSKPSHPDTLASAIQGVLLARRVIEAETRTRIRAEYIEMPGMRLRVEQVRRLCGVEYASSLRVLNALVQERFLVANSDGTYVRATGGGDGGTRHLHLRTRSDAG